MSKGMSKKDLVAIVTLVSAGIWLWKHRPLVEEVRRELDETGRVQLGTLIAILAAISSGAVLLSDAVAAVRHLSR